MAKAEGAGQKSGLKPPWEKGKSGNPSGRPKGHSDLQRLAREHTEEAIATLVAAMKFGTRADSVKVTAANSLLDRGWGRPKEQSGDDFGPLANIPSAALYALIEQYQTKPSG